MTSVELITHLEAGHILGWQQDPTGPHTVVKLYHWIYEDGTKAYTTYGWNAGVINAMDAIMDIMRYPEHWQVLHADTRPATITSGV